MTRLGLRPYQAGDDPPSGSVPVSVVVLTLNEEPNIRRCLASVAWADQVVVVDSGSADGTVPIARSLGAEVVEQPWLGFSAQRELRAPTAAAPARLGVLRGRGRVGVPAARRRDRHTAR